MLHLRFVVLKCTSLCNPDGLSRTQLSHQLGASNQPNDVNSSRGLTLVRLLHVSGKLPTSALLVNIKCCTCIGNSAYKSADWSCLYAKADACYLCRAGSSTTVTCFHAPSLKSDSNSLKHTIQTQSGFSQLGPAPGHLQVACMQCN